MHQIYASVDSHTSDDVLMSACAAVMNMTVHVPSCFLELHNCVAPILDIMDKSAFARPWAVKALYAMSKIYVPTEESGEAWRSVRGCIEAFLRVDDRDTSVDSECSKILRNIAIRGLCSSSE